jgi:hypothetical protein
MRRGLPQRYLDNLAFFAAIPDPSDRVGASLPHGGTGFNTAAQLWG